MKFEVINKDYAVIECRSLQSHTYGLLFMSVGGVMGTIIGFTLIFLPYAEPSYQSFIPFRDSSIKDTITNPIFTDVNRIKELLLQQYTFLYYQALEQVT